MGRMISTGIDVVTFLKEQHDQIEAAFETVDSSSGDQRRSAFYALRRLLAVHETAEEEIVHPAARSLPGGDAIVDTRLQEENEAKKILAKLETLDVDSTDFELLFSDLELSVLAHAKAEETTEFVPLEGQLDQTRLERMQKAVSFAESVAPTRPHAGVESATANILLGPFASMLDRARDAISNKS